MNSNAGYTGRKVTIQSGIDNLTGTVTRTSPTSVWAMLAGREYRFVRSQDGNLRLHGHSTDQSAAVLTFVPEETPAPAPVEAPSEQEALLALATSLDAARIAANAIESAAWQLGVYGDVQKALISTIALIRGGRTDRAERVHDFMLESGLTVSEALAAEKADWEYQTQSIQDLLNPSWGE